MKAIFKFWEEKDNFLLGYIIWLALLMIFALSWQTPTLDVDSCNYAAVAKEILKTGRWLNLYDPVYKGPFYYHFPLVIWVTALFFKISGVNLLTAKLFSMLSALLSAALIFYFGRKLKNSWVGFFGALSFILTNHIARLARQSRMDLPVILFIVLALFCFLLALRKNRYYYLLFGLSTSLAIFTKDISGTAPLVIAALYLVFTFKWKEFFHPLFITACVIAIAPILGWIYLEKILYKQTLFYYWYHWNLLHLARSPAFHVPWYYYLSAILTKYWYFLFFALYGGYLAIKQEFGHKQQGWFLIVIWAIFFPFAFSFGNQKLHYFILPMYPATALLVGLCFDKIFSETIKLRFLKAIKYILIIMTFLILCIPLKLYKERFKEIAKMAPTIDATLSEANDYEFIIYKQDKASALFYLNRINDYLYFEDLILLEKELSKQSNKRRFCYIALEDFQQISDNLKAGLKILFQYDNRLFIADKDTKVIIQ